MLNYKCELLAQIYSLYKSNSCIQPRPYLIFCLIMFINNIFILNNFTADTSLKYRKMKLSNGFLHSQLATILLPSSLSSIRR